MIPHLLEPSLYRFADQAPPDMADRELEYGQERWKALRFGVGRSAGLTLRFGNGEGEPLEGKEGARLRITLAEALQGCALVHAVCPAGQVSLGRFDIRCGFPMQVFELPLSLAEAELVLKHGVSLWAEGQPVSVILQSESTRDTVFRPHLLLGDGRPRLPLMLRHLMGAACFNPSGWVEGCIIEGLLEWHGAAGSPESGAALRWHLDAYTANLRERRRLEEDAPRVVGGRIVADVIEEALPVAAIGKLFEHHELIADAIATWQANRQENDAVFDRQTRTVSTEGAYTVAYPMAVLAAKRQDRELAGLALKQLAARREWLAAEDAIYLRRHVDSGVVSYRNWNRGCAWYLLGLIRTLEALRGVLPEESLQPAAGEFRRVAELAVKHQDYTGLWFNYWDRPESGAETSGSAGVAAALAYGVRAGVLDPSFSHYARLTWTALLSRLAFDGLLTGAAQTNQGGEELQQSGYRTLFSVGMGLTLQLGAALNRPELL